MNILLVDDEIIAINGLRAAVHWDSLGINHVYYAFNVPDAKELLRTQDINILLCDIEMPVETGLDLLEWVQEEKLSIISILLTCHADFTYATMGIKYGILDYLLKPIDIITLEQTIKKAIVQLKQKKDDHQNSKYEKLWSNNKELIAERFWHDITTGIYQNSDYSYIEWNADLHAVDLSAHATYLPILISILSYEKYITEEALLSFSIKNVITELILLGNKSIPTITLSTREYLALLPMEQLETVNEIQQRCKNFDNACLRSLKITTLSRQGTPSEFCKLAKQVTRLREHSGTLTPSDQNKKTTTFTVVDKIKDIVHQNVNQIITRESIGKAIFLNPDYLSKLFKKETGQALSDFIAEVKVTEAKRLLINTDKSIGLITTDLGYTNFSYFSKMFKKETGMSPNQFRQLHE